MRVSHPFIKVSSVNDVQRRISPENRSVCCLELRADILRKTCWHQKSLMKKGKLCIDTKYIEVHPRLLNDSKRVCTFATKPLRQEPDTYTQKKRIFAQTHVPLRYAYFTHLHKTDYYSSSSCTMPGPQCQATLKWQPRSVIAHLAAPLHLLLS